MTSVLTTTSVSAPAHSTAASSKAIKFIAAFVFTLMLGLSALAYTNYKLHPLLFSAHSQREVANVLNSGQNYAVIDPNFDFRGLRREHIATMPHTPDVIIFAGSRFEVATRNTFPGKTFYNAFVHNDYFEDMLALVQLLDEHKKLPKTLVMSVRHISFVPMQKRETEEWKQFVPEYQRMERRLDLPNPGSMDFTPWKHWSQLISPELLKHGIQARFSDRWKLIGPTDTAKLETMDVIHSDGSMAFSDAHVGTFTTESARADARKRAEAASKKKGWPVDEQSLQGLGKLLDFLVAKDVYPVIAVTPHHPDYWDGIASSEYGKTLLSIEQKVRALAQAHQGAFVGSFNPRQAGCTEASFRDYIHLDEACLKSIFDRIPRPGPKQADQKTPSSST